MPNQPKKPARLRLPLEIQLGAEEDVAAPDLAGANLAQQQAHGLTRLNLRNLLANHFDAGHHDLFEDPLAAVADCVAWAESAAFDRPGHDRAPTANADYILDGQTEEGSVVMGMSPVYFG